MRFTSKIWLAAAKNAGRYAMQHIRFERAPEPRMIVTDGRMLAIVPCEMEEGEEAPAEALIDVTAIQAAYKAKHPKRHYGARLDLNGKAKAVEVAGEPEFAYVDGEFPRYQAVMPPADRKGSVRVSFNAEYLYRLAQAMGAHDDCVTLEIVPGGEAVPIRVTCGNKSEGALMPITVGK